MKKIYLFIISSLSISFFLVEKAYAVNISNPAPGFFISYNDNSFAGLLITFINLLLSIVGIISVFFIVYGGFQYITSRGDEELATAGRKTLTNAIIGLVIVIMSYAIVLVIMNALQGRV